MNAVYIIFFFFFPVNDSPENSEGFLKGPLSEGTDAPDSVDGGDEAVAPDPERLEPGLEGEDTDFEEDGDNPDWVSELKKCLMHQTQGGHSTSQEGDTVHEELM